MQVCALTTPAQLFHCLRRQMMRPFRKPLVIMTPKSLLWHKLAVSRVEEFATGRFRTVIGYAEVADPARVRKLLLCSGKVYDTLQVARSERKIGDVGLARIEQLYPFRDGKLRALLAGYPTLVRVVWVQEETKNMGAWRNTRHRLERNLPEGVRLEYVGRSAAASPATGSNHIHDQGEAALVEAAFRS